MTYRLVIAEEASKIVAAMDETTHELFILAALDLPRDPHGLGRELMSVGPLTRRAHALGGFGMIVYSVNDATSIVTVTDIVWTG